MTERDPGRAGRRVGVVVNPERDQDADRLIERLRRSGATVVVRTPRDADDLACAVSELLDDDVDVVAALGGDGTQRAVASRLIGTDTPLAVVPCGTVNLLGSVVGIDDLDTAVEAALGQRTRTIDVGRSGDEIFLLNASLGWDAQVIARVDDRFKRFGRAGFLIAGVLEWRNFRARRIVVRVDGEEWYRGPALTVIVLNAPERGFASVELARSARIDDGRLDVLVVRRRSIVALVRSVWAIVRRRPPRAGDLQTAQGEHIAVEWPCEVGAQRDGDSIGRTDRFEASAVAGALRVAVPDDA